MNIGIESGYPQAMAAMANIKSQMTNGKCFPFQISRFTDFSRPTANAPQVETQEFASLPAARSLLEPIESGAFVRATATRDLDGTFGLRGDRLRDRTERRALRPTVTMRADDDQVSAPTLGLLDDGVFGRIY